MTYSVRAAWVMAAFVAGLGLSSAALAQGPQQCAHQRRLACAERS